MTADSSSTLIQIKVKTARDHDKLAMSGRCAATTKYEKLRSLACALNELM
jgi:hypothetical protein